MPEQKFDPMKELANLRDTLGKAVEKGAQTAGKFIEQGIQTAKNVTGGTTGIKLDVYQQDDQVVIRTSPIDGLVADSIEVSMEGNALTITGETREDEVPQNVNFIVRERKFGIFQRSVNLSIPVKAQQAKAKLEKKGTLTITLPIDVESYTPIDVNDDNDEE